MNAFLSAPGSLLCPAQTARLKVEELARRTGLHVRTLERRFEEHFQTPPKQWMIRDRLARGYELLLQGLSNKEIAHRLGYSQQSNFCRDFKRVYGVAPQALARRTVAPAGRRPSGLGRVVF